MISTTHAILNTALLGRKDHPERNPPLLLGALLPDLPGFVFLVVRTFQYYRNGLVWDFSYYTPAWTPWVDGTHSIPLVLAGCLLFLVLQYRFGLFFCVSMFLHDLEDLPLHAERSHRHFFPFSDWRFISSFSTQEPGHHEAWMILLEWAIVIACAFVLWRRGIPLWSKKSLVLIGLAQGIWAIFFCARMGR